MASLAPAGALAHHGGEHGEGGHHELPDMALDAAARAQLHPGVIDRQPDLIKMPGFQTEDPAAGVVPGSKYCSVVNTGGSTVCGAEE